MNLIEIMNKRKRIIQKILGIVITFIFTIILPIYIYLDTLDLNLESNIEITTYLNRLKISTLQTIIMGTIIIILLICSYFISLVSVYQLILSGAIKTLFLMLIIFSAISEIFEISIGSTYLMIDISVLSLFVIPVPIVSIINSIVKYIYERNDAICKMIIIKTISSKKFNSKSKIRKDIFNNKEIKQDVKRYLLKNFNDIFLNLENHHNYPLVMRVKTGYIVTKEGRNFLKSKGIKISDEFQEENIMQVWTESELQDLAHKRGINIQTN